MRKRHRKSSSVPSTLGTQEGYRQKIVKKHDDGKNYLEIKIFLLTISGFYNKFAINILISLFRP